VLFLEHKRLYSLKGDVDEAPVESLGRAVVRRAGADLTIVTAMRGVQDCLAAAQVLEEDGIDTEVIDLRTLRPLDIATILESVAKTNRLLVVEEGPRTGGWAGEVLTRVVEDRLEDLDDAWRLTTDDLPVPYSPVLEDAFLPSSGRIASAVRERTQ